MKMKHLFQPLSFLLASSFLLRAQAGEAVYGQHAMVVAQEPLAADVGLEVIKNGGNAVDAAVAVGFALAVTYPCAGNIGGGGFMTICMADGRSTFIDFREKAPGKASHDMYLDSAAFSKSLVGWRSSGVPGTVRGFELAWKHYGSTNKFKWAGLLNLALSLATNGFKLSASNAALFKNSRGKLMNDPESKGIFFTNGAFYPEGALFRQPDLGRTLNRIALDPDDFYTKVTAHLIADAMAAHDGLITLDDLRNYNAVERKPLKGSYRGYEIITAPPPSSGGICILQMLGMLENTGFAKSGQGTAGYYHYLAEVMRRSFADRMQFLGDPDFMMPPMTTLLNPAYLKGRAAAIDPDRATPTERIKPGTPQTMEGTDTTHFSIIDRDGNAVAVTYTLNMGFGNGITVPGAGFLLNDEMDDFATRPGSPDAFGIMQGEMNAIAPNKRPLSSMSPTIVLKDKKPFLILGAPGGGMIITAVLQVLVNVADFDMTAQAAVDAPRIHQLWYENPQEDYLQVEAGVPPDVITQLKNMGYKIRQNRPIVAARVEAILVHTNGIEGARDWTRGDGKAAGW